MITAQCETDRSRTHEAVLPLASAPPRPAAANRDATLLLVDDEASVRRVMARILQRAGYGVLEAANGVEALERFRLHQARIRGVVLDLTMPVMGGEETLRQLKLLDPRVRVLLSSGYAPEAAGALARSDSEGFLAKPFSAETLLAQVATLVASR